MHTRLIPRSIATWLPFPIGMMFASGDEVPRGLERAARPAGAGRPSGTGNREPRKRSNGCDCKARWPS